MAKKKESALTEINNIDGTDFLRVISGNNSRKIPFSKFPKATTEQSGLMSATDKRRIISGILELAPGQEYEVPHSGANCIMAIQNRSSSRKSGLALIHGDLNSASIIVAPTSDIVFGTDTEGKVSIFKKEWNGTVFIKNNASEKYNIGYTYIGITM